MLLTKKTDFSDGVSMTNFIKRTWSRVKDHLLFLFSILRPCHSLLLCFQASVAEEKVYILGYVETISDSFWRRHEKLSGNSMNSNGPRQEQSVHTHPTLAAFTLETDYPLDNSRHWQIIRLNLKMKRSYFLMDNPPCLIHRFFRQFWRLILANWIYLSLSLWKM